MQCHVLQPAPGALVMPFGGLQHQPKVVQAQPCIPHGAEGMTRARVHVAFQATFARL